MAKNIRYFLFDCSVCLIFAALLPASSASAYALAQDSALSSPDKVIATDKVSDNGMTAVQPKEDIGRGNETVSSADNDGWLRSERLDQAPAPKEAKETKFQTVCWVTGFVIIQVSAILLAILMVLTGYYILNKKNIKQVREAKRYIKYLGLVLTGLTLLFFLLSIVMNVA